MSSFYGNFRHVVDTVIGIGIHSPGGNYSSLVFTIESNSIVNQFVFGDNSDIPFWYKSSINGTLSICDSPIFIHGANVPGTNIIVSGWNLRKLITNCFSFYNINDRFNMTVSVIEGYCPCLCLFTCTHRFFSKSLFLFSRFISDCTFFGFFWNCSLS